MFSGWQGKQKAAATRVSRRLSFPSRSVCRNAMALIQFALAHTLTDVSRSDIFIAHVLWPNEPRPQQLYIDNVMMKKFGSVSGCSHSHVAR